MMMLLRTPDLRPDAGVRPAPPTLAGQGGHTAPTAGKRAAVEAGNAWQTLSQCTGYVLPVAASVQSQVDPVRSRERDKQ